MTAKADTRSRAYWLKTLHQWHWISSAVCLVGLLLFSITGITLNHAAQIEAQPRIDTRELQLPDPVRAELVARASGARPPAAAGRGDQAALPAEPAPALPEAVIRWAAGELAVDLRGREVEWSTDEVYVALPRPGGDAWLRIGLPDGELTYERTDRGWISYLNDLHKGRHTGVAWSWFIDLFAVACLVFAITGLFILKMHAANRPSTWPVVGFGVALPAVLAILFVH
ncbi:MAG: PepSY-associated TM helix domain-containing protein [Lautropia sp.]